MWVGVRVCELESNGHADGGERFPLESLKAVHVNS